MKFGNRTLVFADKVRVGTPDEGGNYDFEDVTYSAQWCRHRPMTFQEMVDAELDIATEWWRSTVPVHEYDDELRTKVMATKHLASFTVDDLRYQVNGGVRTHDDFEGLPFKATIISKRQTG